MKTTEKQIPTTKELLTACENFDWMQVVLNELHVGKRYFFSKDKRTDQFAHKRYTNPECEQYESIIVMGRVVKQRGGEVLVVIEDCGMQKPDPLDGDEIVFSVMDALIDPDSGALRTMEEHGKPPIQIGRWKPRP